MEMGVWGIIKILLMLVGSVVVLDHTPGIDILGDGRGDYKALVKCEAKHQGLKRECREAIRQCRVTLDELKKKRKENKKLEKENRKLSKKLASVPSDRGGGRRDRLRGGENGGAGGNGWKRIFPWR